MRSRRPRVRRAFSLLEAILASGIFIAAMAVLGSLIDLGLFSARLAKLATMGQLRCESKIEELAAGIEPLVAGEAVPFPDDDAWRYSVEIAPTEIPTLVKVVVRVEHMADEETPDYECRLARWLAIPPPPAPAAPEAPGVPVTIAELLGVGGSAERSP